MTLRSPRLALLLVLLVLVPLGRRPRGRHDDDVRSDAKRPGPDVVVHVPIDEMDVLLRADRRGVVLKHEEYERLLAEARLQSAVQRALPPADGSILFAEGVAGPDRPGRGTPGSPLRGPRARHAAVLDPVLRPRTCPRSRDGGG